MYSSVSINGYRGLDSFRLEGLGRINLLVGENNCGKTSVLESFELLRSPGSLKVLRSILGRRGELGYIHRGDDEFETRLNVRHLFANRDLHSKVSIEADRINSANVSGWNNKVMFSVEDIPGEEPQVEEDEELILKIDWADERDMKVGITFNGLLRLHPYRPLHIRHEPGKIGLFIGTNGMSKREVAQMFDVLVLTKDEEHVTQALRIVEPKLERIASASVADGRPRQLSASVFLKLEGIEERIPIGSAGDGMWRMLGLALAVSNAKGGVLLVDEIDTGLHYSVMKNMWRMISQRADALNVQVFATTHSRDCYESLAAIAEPDSSPCSVTIQRIDSSRGQVVGFSNDEIVAAAKRGIEVR